MCPRRLANVGCVGTKGSIQFPGGRCAHYRHTRLLLKGPGVVVVVVVVGLRDLHLRWYGLQPGWGPPSPQLTTLRHGVVGNWARNLFPAG